MNLHHKMQGRRSVVVTGASTGIGWAATKVLVERGVHVLGSVRREEDARRLTETFGAEWVTPLHFDVTDAAAVQAGADRVREHLAGTTLLGLVNNAGITGVGPLLQQPVEEFRRVLEVNLVGVVSVVQAFAPLLGAESGRTGNPGRIVNIGSTAGQMAPPFMASYAASKFGLEGFSESLRRELMLYGIDVIVVGPGAVETPIWDKGAASEAIDRCRGTEYADAFTRFGDLAAQERRSSLTAELVGTVIWQALTTPRPRVRYTVAPQPLLTWLLAHGLPKRITDRLIARKLGLSR